MLDDKLNDEDGRLAALRRYDILDSGEEEPFQRVVELAQVIFDALATKPEYHVVAHAGHFAFLAPCSAPLAALVPDICRDPPGLDREAFHRDFNASVAAFFKAHLPPRP